MGTLRLHTYWLTVQSEVPLACDLCFVDRFRFVTYILDQLALETGEIGIMIDVRCAHPFTAWICHVNKRVTKEYRISAFWAVT